MAHVPDRMAALVDAALPFSRTGQAIIERYVSGPEFSPLPEVGEVYESVEVGRLKRGLPDGPGPYRLPPCA